MKEKNENGLVLNESMPSSSAYYIASGVLKRYIKDKETLKIALFDLMEQILSIKERDYFEHTGDPEAFGKLIDEYVDNNGENPSSYIKMLEGEMQEIVKRLPAGTNLDEYFLFGGRLMNPPKGGQKGE